MNKINNFETFIQRLDESKTQREIAISTAVSKIKERYGNNIDEFLKSVQKDGVDVIKDYVVKVLEPYLNGIEAERRGKNGQLLFDFDGLIKGMITQCLVELELQIMKKQKPN